MITACVAALGRAVLHDRHQRIDGAGRRAARQDHAMAGDEIDIGLADLVDGAEQFDLLVPGQIAQIENARLAEGDQHPDRAGIFLAAIIGGLLHTGAIGIGLAGAGQRRIRQLAVRADELDVHRADIQRIAGLGEDMGMTLIGRHQDRIARLCRRGTFLAASPWRAEIRGWGHDRQRYRPAAWPTALPARPDGRRDNG